MQVSCCVGIQFLLSMFLFYIMKYIVLCFSLNVIIISWKGVHSQIRLIFWLIKACFGFSLNH